MLLWCYKEQAEGKKTPSSAGHEHRTKKRPAEESEDENKPKSTHDVRANDKHGSNYTIELMNA